MITRSDNATEMNFDKEARPIKTDTEIRKRYKELYPGPTPIDAPWMFDPLNPPDDWYWDSEWEFWSKK